MRRFEACSEAGCLAVPLHAAVERRFRLPPSELALGLCLSWSSACAAKVQLVADGREASARRRNSELAAEVLLYAELHDLSLMHRDFVPWIFVCIGFKRNRAL